MRAIGFAPGDIVLNCFGYHLTPAAAMFEEGAHAVGCVVVPAGIGNSELQVAVAAHYRATGYIGLPSYLKVLLEQAKKSGVPLAIAKALVLAEKLPESLRAEFQRRARHSRAPGVRHRRDGRARLRMRGRPGLPPGPRGARRDRRPGNRRAGRGRDARRGRLHAAEPGLRPAALRHRRSRGARHRALPLRAHDAPAHRDPRPRRPEHQGPRPLPAPGAADRGARGVPRGRALPRRHRARARHGRPDRRVRRRRHARADARKAIGARVKETTKLSARVVQLEAGSIPDGAPVIDDRRNWD